MAKGRLTRGIVAGAVYGGAKAYGDELDYQAKVRDQTARDEAIFKRQQEHDNARDEALYKRMQRAEEIKQEKLDKLEAAHADIYKTGAAAAREKGVNPSSAAGLRFIAEAYGNAGMQAQANKYEAAADDVQGREDAYDAKQKADLRAEQKADAQFQYQMRMADAAERRAGAAEARAAGGGDKEEPLSKVAAATRKEIGELFSNFDTNKRDVSGKAITKDASKFALATLDSAYAQARENGATPREALEYGRVVVTSIAPYVAKAGGDWGEGFGAFKKDGSPAVAATDTTTTTGAAAKPPPAAAPVVNDLPSASTFSPGENAGRSPDAVVTPAPAAVPAPVTQTKFGQVKQQATPARASLSGILNSGGTDTTGSMATLFKR